MGYAFAREKEREKAKYVDQPTSCEVNLFYISPFLPML